MKASEIRGLNDEQMEERLKELHTELRDMRFQEAVGQLTQTSRPREVRKDIARIHTVRTEKAAQAAE